MVYSHTLFFPRVNLLQANLSVSWRRHALRDHRNFAYTVSFPLQRLFNHFHSLTPAQSPDFSSVITQNSLVRFHFYWTLPHCVLLWLSLLPHKVLQELISDTLKALSTETKHRKCSLNVSDFKYCLKYLDQVVVSLNMVPSSFYRETALLWQ